MRIMTMTFEAGLLIGRLGNILYEHLPPGRTAGGLPDSRELWEVIWKNRRALLAPDSPSSGLLGFAHSHPGRGKPIPSPEDLTTFQAVEAGLGERLLWFICTEDQLSVCYWLDEADNYVLLGVDDNDKPLWLDRLRELSYKL